MTVYKAALLKLLDRLSDKSIKRLYQLAQYLYVYKEQEVLVMMYKDLIIKLLDTIDDEALLIKIYIFIKTCLKDKAQHGGFRQR